MKRRDLTIVAITVLVMSIPLMILAQKLKSADPMPSTAFEWKSIKVTPTKNGERRQFFQSPTATLDEIECHVTTLNAGEISHPPHQHPEEELMILKEGMVECLVNGELKTVGPGSIVFQAANQLHNTKNAGNTQAVYYAIKWKSSKTGSGKTN